MPLVFHLIPHTHWDREWYLTRAAFVARLVPMMDDLVARLEAEPSFRSFLLDGQTIHLEDYLAVRAEQAARIGALVRAGRLQVGPWYVLADEVMPSGESLIRNLLIGVAQARSHGGRLDVLYSPDAFGHPGCLPTLAREFGLDAAVVWRGLATERDLFRWRGPNGAALLTYHLPPDGYEIGAALPAGWPAVRAALVARAATRHVAVFVGADHHAAPAAIGRMREALAAAEPDAEVRVSRLDEFLVAAGTEARGLPERAGELRWSDGYTWTLQDVHSMRAPLKRRLSRTEMWLERFAEPLAALAVRAGRADQRPLLASAWRTLIQCQFHDTIAGTCADAAARESDVRLAGVAATAREIVTGALAALSGYDADRSRDQRDEAAPSLVVWNAAARPRGGVVVADLTFFRRDVLVGRPGGRVAAGGAGYRPLSLRDPAGRTLPLQVIERRHALERRDAARHYPDLDEVDVVRVAFDVATVPGLGLSVLAAGPAGPSVAGSVVVRGRTMRNEHLEVTIERTGSIALRDRASGATYRRLLTLESEPDGGDTYTFDPRGNQPVERDSGPVTVRAHARGPLVGLLGAQWEFAGTNVHLRVALHAGERLLRCTLDLHNVRGNRRLRARLPIGTAAAATAGAAFGSETRAMRTPGGDSALERRSPTDPAHRYVVATAERRGLAVLAPGFFEYEWTGHDLLLTLLRSVGDLSRGDLAARPGHAGWVTPTPDAQCLGHDRVELALTPVGADGVAAGDTLPRLWEDAFLPVRGQWLRQAAKLDPAHMVVELDGPGLVLSAVKPADDGDGVVLRCFNARSVPTVGHWRISPWPSGAERLRADETAGSALVLQRDRSVSFDAGPHELVTIRIR